ncbi:c-type cytochrome [Rhabdothermincola sp.]|uniref:c-type cytochrome n=1 Tax=Rhabdothermincola sp. TaxID=2820405 RepID=UPI002FE07106
MTEVPEHLLKRSRDRRAALGLGGEGGGEAAAPAQPAAGAEVEPATPAAAAKPAAAAPAEVEPAPPAPLPPYVEAALTRKRIPFWAMPVLAILPVWAILYAGSLSPAKVGQVSQLDLGAQVYAARCASCHGGGGGGGVGRPLAGGEVLKTFPDIESMLEFVAIGSDGIGIGNGYGDPNREGGQHIAGSYNGNKMPAFGDVLTDTELFAVVRHERETLSGEKLEGQAAGPDGTRLTSNGKPYLDAAGQLVTPDGQPLLDASGKLTIEIAQGSPAEPGQPSGR